MYIYTYYICLAMCVFACEYMYIYMYIKTERVRQACRGQGSVEG